MPGEGDGFLIMWSFPVKSQTLIHFGKLDSETWLLASSLFRKVDLQLSALIKPAAVSEAMQGIRGRCYTEAQVSQREM